MNSNTHTFETESGEPKLISTAEVSRRLNVPLSRVRRALVEGALTPAQIVSGMQLWRVSDLSDIASVLELLNEVRCDADLVAV